MTSSDTAQGSSGPASAEPTDSSAAAVPLKPFMVPEASAVPMEKRRTWEGYASDFRDLSEKLATLQQALDVARSEREALVVRYGALQIQRRDDQDRLALVARARDALEANSAAQAHRTRAAQDELSARNKTIANLENERDRFVAEISGIQARLAVLQERNNVLETDNATLSAENDALRSSAQHAYMRSANLPMEAAAKDAATILDQEANIRLPAAARRTAHAAPSSLLDRISSALMLRRARQAARRGHWPHAEALYEAVLMDRDDARLWMQLGHAHREQRAYGDAAAAYRQALARKPDNGECYFMLGLAEAGQGDKKAASEAYRQARMLDSSLIDIHGELQDPALQD